MPKLLCIKSRRTVRPRVNFTIYNLYRYIIYVYRFVCSLSIYICIHTHTTDLVHIISFSNWNRNPEKQLRLICTVISMIPEEKLMLGRAEEYWACFFVDCISLKRSTYFLRVVHLYWCLVLVPTFCGMCLKYLQLRYHFGSDHQISGVKASYFA